MLTTGVDGYEIRTHSRKIKKINNNFTSLQKDNGKKVRLVHIYIEFLTSQTFKENRS